MTLVFSHAWPGSYLRRAGTGGAGRRPRSARAARLGSPAFALVRGDVGDRDDRAVAVAPAWAWWSGSSARLHDRRGQAARLPERGDARRGAARVAVAPAPCPAIAGAALARSKLFLAGGVIGALVREPLVGESGVEPPADGAQRSPRTECWQITLLRVALIVWLMARHRDRPGGRRSDLARRHAVSRLLSRTAPPSSRAGVATSMCVDPARTTSSAPASAAIQEAVLAACRAPAARRPDC